MGLSSISSVRRRRFSDSRKITTSFRWKKEDFSVQTRKNEDKSQMMTNHSINSIKEPIHSKEIRLE